MQAVFSHCQSHRFASDAGGSRSWGLTGARGVTNNEPILNTESYLILL